jgi:hypothetical protein
VLQAHVLTDQQELDALAEDWEQLVERSAGATPFQSHGWLASWWQSYGRPGRLRVVTVRRPDGRLVALAPLMRGPGGLRPIGVGLTDFHDVLIDPEHAEQAAPVLARALARQLRAPWATLDLREVRADASARLLAAHWPGRAAELPDSLCQHLPGLPMDDLLRRLPGRTAQRTRVKLRKLAAAGVVVRDVPAAEMPQAVDRLLALHALQWTGRGVTREHLRERFAAHLRRSAVALAARGRAAMHEYELDGRLIAVDLELMARGIAALYFYGVHPSARERLDIAGMLFGENLAHALRSGMVEINLLRGDEPYKQRWRPERSQNARLLLGRGPAVRLRVALLRTDRALRDWAKRRAPWLRKAARIVSG